MKVIFNSKVCDTEAKTTGEFFFSKESSIDDVWILNGFATKEDLELKEGDELFCIPKNKLPPEGVLDSMMRSRHTPGLHEKLKKSRVAVCGLGGLGSHIAIMLARSGIGSLLLIDFDTIDASNLNRQSYYVSDLGRLKTEAIRDQIFNINPFVRVEINTCMVTYENVCGLFLGCDVVCEAFDNVSSKNLLLKNFSKFYDIPLICASGMAGFGDSNSISTHKIAQNVYVCGDLKSSASPGRGLMSPRVNICAAHQANLVLELLSLS